MGRAPCCDKNGLKKGPWTPEEDQKLIDYINEHGHGSWRTLPKNAGLARCGKSCRLRWTNYLRPDIKRGRFSFEEEETIIQLHGILGNKWSAIAARLPGRTDNEIKNYWNTHIRKRLLKMGIDPVTHAPRLDLNNLATLLNLSMYNQANQIGLNKLLALDPLVSNELLRMASQQQNTNLLNHNMVNQQQFPQTPFSEGNLVDCIQAPGQMMNPTAQMIDLQLMQSANIGQFQPVCNELDNLVNYGNMDPCMTTLNSDCSTNFSESSDRNFNLTSSPTNFNSSSTTYMNGSSLEDESFCSDELLNFQFSDLLDMSDFL